MALTRLALTDFRNHRAAMLEPTGNFVVLTGENGAGKTNILEAVSLLVPGRGLRGAALADMARSDGPGGFAIAGRFGEIDLGTGALASAPDRRIVRINGAPASASALSEWLSIVWLTPAMDRLFVEGASERRRFLDRLVLALEPAHARHTTRYDAAMRQRNRLLGEDQPADPDWLAALEAQMAEHGVAIAQAQKALLLGIVLAHADLVAAQAGRRPILLLDEIAAHLDPVRRAALFDRLAAGGGQVWMTGTEPGLFSSLGTAAGWYRVEEGQVSPSAASRHPH